MNAPFVILALPRSRTYWLSRFLSYGDWTCSHDELRHVRSLDDARAWLRIDGVGTAETVGAFWWRLLAKYRPDARVITIRRPVGDVVDSLARLGIDRDSAARLMRRLDAKLDQIEARLPNVKSIQFADLAKETVCAELFEHCLPYGHDASRWRAMTNDNLQYPLAAMARYFAAYREPLERVARAAKQEILADLSGSKSIDAEGLTIQSEPFEEFLRDGKALFAEHSARVGEEPDSYLRKNIPLMRKLDSLGNLIVTTARCNGRMFGYLMTVLGPSLESESGTTSINTTLYASPLFPGLGLKLHRSAIAAMRKRGIDEMFFRAGNRGDGPRISSIFRRLGAEPSGELYRLDLRTH